MATSDVLGLEAHLDGKLALVTGGTSGIGLGAAKAIAAAGAKVAIAGRRDATDLAAEFGASYLPYDAADPAAAEQLLDAATAAGDKLDILVVAAGIYEAEPLDGAADEMLERVMDVNLLSVGRLLNRVPKYVNRGGSVIVTSSTAAVFAAPEELAYGASKAGVEAMARIAARELAGDGIRVNCVRPGPIDTPMTPDELRQFVGKTVPTGRLGRVEEAAGLYLYLASDASTFVTGALIAVDGGESTGMSPGAFE